jgi:putative transposase
MSEATFRKTYKEKLRPTAAQEQLLEEVLCGCRDLYNKAVALLAKAHQRIAPQPRDFHHKQAHKVVEGHDVIYHEDLRVATMVRNQRLAKSIDDAGWSAFLAILTFKAVGAGRRVRAVDPAFTSQKCSGQACGVIVTKGLSARWQSCPEWGTSLHRDHNAALNILRLGPRAK